MQFLRNMLRDPENQIDDRLHMEIGAENVKEYAVNVKEMPAYRFVDLYRAITTKLSKKNDVRTIESGNYEDLNSLLHGERPNWGSRKITRSSRTAWVTAAEEEVFLPTDQYWIFTDDGTSGRNPIIVRLRYRQSDERAVLEVAALDSDTAEKSVGDFIEESLRISIYRNQMLTISFEAGTKDEYGDIEKVEQLRISFKVASSVPKENFVVDEVVYKTLWRNVIDLHKRRALLKKHGVPIRRGVLLYGPPGTGKTFACRYICGELPDTTRIIVAGTALNRVAQIFDLARTYQPSIVILEDVDLVFAARDINLFSSALGDLLDQMDGLRPFEDIGVILTTNSIDRMESAIKDRPGRISQCIYFGAPERAMRENYIAQYAKDYDYSAVQLEELVAMTKGTTPAFIKEWIHRTVQIATERIQDDHSRVALTTEDFRAAFEEMKRFTDESSGRIIGFVGGGAR